MSSNQQPGNRPREWLRFLHYSTHYISYKVTPFNHVTTGRMHVYSIKPSPKTPKYRSHHIPTCAVPFHEQLITRSHDSWRNAFVARVIFGFDHNISDNSRSFLLRRKVFNQFVGCFRFTVCFEVGVGEGLVWWEFRELMNLWHERRRKSGLKNH